MGVLFPEKMADSLTAAGIAGPVRALLWSFSGLLFLAMGGIVGVLIGRNLSTETAQAAKSPPPTTLPSQVPSAKPEPVFIEPIRTPVQTKTTEPDDFLPPVTNSPTWVQTKAAPSLNVSMNGESVQEIDELIEEGSYRFAREHLLRMLVHRSSREEARLRFRLGLCEEALGNVQQAQAEFLRVVELHPGPVLEEAALLGQTRIWMQSGRSSLAIAALFRVLLEGTRGVDEASLSQIPHQLGALCAARAMQADDARSGPLTACKDSRLIPPMLNVRPSEILYAISGNEFSSHIPLPLMTGDVEIVQRFSSSPEEIFISLQTERLTAREILQLIAARAEVTIQLAENLATRLHERTLQPNCRDLPLALVLDAILEPFDLIWRSEGGSILVLKPEGATVEQVSEYRIQAATRALRHACTASPDHPWAAVSYLELARVQSCTDSVQAGIQSLQKAIELFPRSEFLPVAWFNLGKLQLRCGSLTDARESFLRAADMMGGHPLEPVTYLYAGRIQLESDQPRESISPLTRALVLAEGTPYEPLAALTLSSAYFLLEHYQRANEILMEHRKALASAATRDLAAFHACFVRFRGTMDEQQRLREGTQLIGALTTLDPTKAFGGHWPYLIGLAYRETGMLTEEAAVFRQCLENGYPFPLQDRMRLLILDDSVGGYTSRRTEIFDAATPGSPEFQTEALIREADLALREGHTEETLQRCREVLRNQNASESGRRAALRLMGRIYQLRGEHQLAVQCYTGIIPPEPAPIPLQSAKHPEKGPE